MLERRDGAKGRMHYLEVKRLLLLSYCQAIVFYLLLKSEGHPVQDHPVVGRLVEIKALMEQVICFSFLFFLFIYHSSVFDLSTLKLLVLTGLFLFRIGNCDLICLSFQIFSF